MEIRKHRLARGKETKKLYAFFMFGDRRCRVPLFENAKASHSAASQIEQLVDLQLANATLPPELSRWVEGMPGTMRERLAKYGILSAARAAAGRPLEAHLNDWQASLAHPSHAPQSTAEYFLPKPRFRQRQRGSAFWIVCSADLPS